MGATNPIVSCRKLIASVFLISLQKNIEVLY